MTDPTREDYERAAAVMRAEAVAARKHDGLVTVTAQSMDRWASLLTAAAERMTWRPIAEAPRDGTVVMVARDMGDPWGWVLGTGYHVVHAVTGGVAITGWICRGFMNPPGELGLAAPTHWLPLPPAPKMEGAE